MRLSIVIVVLALIASAGGLLLEGLYCDNAFVTKTWLGNDAVTLFLAIPILAAALPFALRGSLRAQLIWLGALDYMLYSYAFYLFGAAFLVCMTLSMKTARGTIPICACKPTSERMRAVKLMKNRAKRKRKTMPAGYSLNDADQVLVSDLIRSILPIQPRQAGFVFDMFTSNPDMDHCGIRVFPIH